IIHELPIGHLVAGQVLVPPPPEQFLEPRRDLTELHGQPNEHGNLTSGDTDLGYPGAYARSIRSASTSASAASGGSISTAAPRYGRLPVAASTRNAPIELLVRSAAYRNLPFGVRCRSEAQMSLSVFRPGEGRGAPGTSLLSGGKALAELTSLSVPVLPSRARVVTVAVSSLRRYTKRLSAEVMR